MPKNVIVCLDGTNNEVNGTANTNVVRLYNMLDLSDRSAQVAYYAPGVGTASAPGAWTPLARTATRYEGLAFGAGLRQELDGAYTFLMDSYEDGDRVFVFGFSRGAYTARALTGLLDLVGLFRPGAENLVPYAISVYSKRKADWAGLRAYTQSFARVLPGGSNRIPIRFLGLWDTVKAAGTLWRPLTWPYTRRLRNVQTVRHAISIDEKRRPFAPYPVVVDPAHPLDLDQVWFAGVHSDVGGTYPTGARLSDIPFKWMAQHAANRGLVTVGPAYRTAMTQVTEDCATGPVHKNGAIWALVGSKRRVVPPDARVHASVQDRIRADPGYGRHIPETVTYVDPDWLTST